MALPLPLPLPLLDDKADAALFRVNFTHMLCLTHRRCIVAEFPYVLLHHSSSAVRIKVMAAFLPRQAPQRGGRVLLTSSCSSTTILTHVI
jgi:hypothetical protein